MTDSKNKWLFFGTSHFSVLVLEELKTAGFLPALVVTVPDKPKGRKLILTPPETKVWAEQNGIHCIQPHSLREEKNPGIVDEIKSHSPSGFDFAVVASYGKIIPQNILYIPRLGMLNVHPSLLPKLRGASPLQTAILNESETGVTIMRLDAEMDHGPIVAQEKISVPDWPPYENDLENLLGKAGGKLLAKKLPDWLSGKIVEVEQEHDKATFCKKIEKEDGLLNLDDPAETNLRKIRAYHIWPGAYFFAERGDKKIRVLIKRAGILDDKLVLEKVVPEDKKEMDYNAFQRGLRQF
jgi:methionyl-tRNA formyltransferase